MKTNNPTRSPLLIALGLVVGIVLSSIYLMTSIFVEPTTDIMLVGEALEQKGDYGGWYLSPSPEGKGEFSLWLQKHEGKQYGFVLLNSTNHISQMEKKMNSPILTGIDIPFMDYSYLSGTWPFYGCAGNFWDPLIRRHFYYEPKQGFLVVVSITPEQLAKLKQSKQ